MKGRALPSKDVICECCLRWTWHRGPGSYPFNSFPGASQPCLSSHISSLLWSFPSLCWSPDYMATNEILCAVPLRGHLGFEKSTILPWQVESPLIFTARCYMGSSSHMHMRLVETPCSSGGDFCSWDVPPDSQLLYMDVGPALFKSLPFLPISMWLLL